MTRLLRLVAVATATLSWSVVVLLTAEMAGVFARGQASATSAMPPYSDDPCALRQPLAFGSDARCAFDLSRKDLPALVVELDQRWEGNVLTQRLTVRDSAPHPLYAITARSAGAQPSRVQRLFPMPGAGRGHIAYVLGLCGGMTCGASEVWVVDPLAGGVMPLVRLAVTQTPAVEVRPDGTLEVIESADRLGVGTLVIRHFRWDGGRYRMETATRQRSGPR